MITKKIYKTREQWLAGRGQKPVIGGSNIGTILGLNPYCTPYQFWLKIQSEELSGEAESERMSRGRFMEDGIAKWFEQQTGEKVIKNSGQIVVYHNDKFPDYMQVAPDREIFQRSRDSRPVLEVKDTAKVIDTLDMETIPPEWFAQLQYQMGYMERSTGILAICDGRKELKYQSFEFSAEYFEQMIERAVAWWERHVIAGEMPEPETASDANIMWPESEAKVVQVPQSIAEVASKYKQLKQQISEREKELKELSDIIAVTFAEADTIEFDGTPVATYKTQTRRNVDAKALKEKYPEIYDELCTENKFRTLRIK